MTDPEPITILVRVVQSANDFFDHTTISVIEKCRGLEGVIEEEAPNEAATSIRPEIPVPVSAQ